VRGGGGNFGVVTSFKYRLHPLTQVLGGVLTYPKHDLRRVLRFVREYTSTAPDELTLYAGVAHVAGEPVCCVYVCYCGEPGAGERILAPLRAFSPPLTDSVRQLPYLDVQNLVFDSFFGHRVSSAELTAMRISFYAKSGFFRDLSENLIDTVAQGIAQAPSTPWFSFVEHFHGAACRVAPEESAFSHRESGYNLETVVLWQNPADANAAIGWLRNYWQAVSPFLSTDVYVNHLAYDDEERVKAAYGANYARLVALKDKYDPTNFFCMNQNIKPSA
jgi:FAD/FMN-containing dehydrogenase